MSLLGKSKIYNDNYSLIELRNDDQGLYSQHFIFFLTYELAEYASVTFQ